eukprot:gene4021-10844_t
MAALNEQMAAVEAQAATNAAELAAAQQEVKGETAALDGTYKFAKQKVKIDMGGTRFTTARSTLKACPESLLAAMFSGRYQQLPDEQEGSFFIDRDGRYFHHILNYLRSPKEFEMPKDLQTLNRVLNDASFFRVTPLMAVVSEAIRSIQAAGQSLAAQQQRTQRW